MLPFVLLQTNAVNLRSEPSSRTTLMGEQPNPWNVLPLQDVMSRHRTRITFFFNAFGKLGNLYLQSIK
jgi:hypothetical protein